MEGNTPISEYRGSSDIYMNTSTDLTFRVTTEALEAVSRGDEAWIQAHLAVAAFLEIGAVPVIGKYRLRDLVFYRIGNRQYARAHVIPMDPRTPAQLRVRDIVSSLSREWRRLTPEQRRAWNAAAEWVLSRLHLTQGRLTGELLFMKLNFVLRLLGRELLVWPTERVVFQPSPVGELVIRREHEQVRLELRLSGPVEEDILVYGEAGVSAGRKKPRHPVFLCLLPAPRGGLSDITKPYVARFGVPEPGKKIIICTRQQKDGWQDEVTKVSGEVVPEKPPRNRPPNSPRKTRKTRKVAEAGFKGLGELLGLQELHGLNELHELYGLYGFQPPRPSAFSILPYLFFLPPLPRSLGTPQARWGRAADTPMCMGKSSEIAPFPRCFPSPSTFDPFPARLASLAGCFAGCPSRHLSFVRGVRRVGSGGSVPGKRRKCHSRERWRGS